MGGCFLRNEIRGYLAVAVAAVLWGVGGSVAKLMFNQAMSPFLLVKLRLTLSFLVLAVGLFFYKPQLLKISKKDIGYFAILGIFGMSAVNFFYYFTILSTNVATAVFLQYLAPVFMAAYAVFWQKTSLGWFRGGAVFLATLGGLLILLGTGDLASINMMGVASGFLSAIFMAFNTIFGQRAVRQYHPVTALLYSIGFGALFWWAILPYGWESGSITPAHLAMLSYVVIFSTIIPFLLYFIGMRFLPPTNVGITACMEPVWASLVAYWALGETMGVLQIGGGALVVIAVILLQLNFKSKHDIGGS